MGRSVYTPADAVQTVYLDVSEFTDRYMWEELIDDLRHVLQEIIPSMHVTDTWLGREGHKILGNQHADVVIAEYGGIASVSLVPCSRPGYGEPEYVELAKNWCARVGFAKHMRKMFGGSCLERMGTMSNGVSVFKKI